MDKTIFQELSILYVEDEQEIRDEFKMMLESRFKAVYVAENGADGLEQYNLHHPDLVLTDVTMPVMDGLEMARHIKEADHHQLIILLTALNDSSSLATAINLGIDGYLSKPVRMSNVLNTLAKHAENIMLKKAYHREQKLLVQYKKAVDSGASVFQCDVNGNILKINHDFSLLSGYTDEELCGKHYSVLLCTEDIANNTIGDAMHHATIWKGEIKNRKQDGSEYYVAVTMIPIKESDDTIIEFLFLCQDITQQVQYSKILETRLDDSVSNLNEKTLLLREYENAIEVSNAFTRTDPLGNITHANDLFCQLSGYTKEELIGQPHSIVRHSEVPKSFFHDMWQTIEARQTWRGTIQNRHKNGSSFYVETTIVPILNAKREIVEYMSIRHDVTELIHLSHEIEETQKEVVFTMGSIGEARSKETGNHVKRVAEYSKLFALECGILEEEAELIKMASPMHDIGKVGIPDSILNKPGKLDRDEWVIMQTHSALGYEMLRHSQRPILKTAAIIALEHHEKWDGSGYPNGKKGEDIHIYGRITAIADVFDALGSDRCYKKAWELEKIYQLFKEERGKHFDPSLVDIFFDKLHLFLEIREKFQDDVA